MLTVLRRILLVVACLVPGLAAAAACTVGASTVWSNLSTVCGFTPGSGDTITISGATTLTVDQTTAAAGSIIIGSANTAGATLSFSSSTAHLTVSGNVQFGNGGGGRSGSINMTNGGILTVQSFSINNLSTWTPGTGTVELTATNTLPNNSSFVAFNNLTITSGTTTLSRNTTVSGNLVVNGTLAGASTLLLNGTNTNIDGTGSITNTGTLSITTGAKSILSTASLSIASPILVTGAITVTNNGSVTSTSASGIVGSAAGSTWTNSANSTLNISGPLFAPTGTLNASGAGNEPNTVNYTGAAQTVKATSYNNLALSGSGADTMTGVTTITGDLAVSGSATMTGNAAFTVTGALNYSSSGSTTLTAATSISVGTYNQTAGTLNGNSNTITVTGTGANVWTMTGTFTPGATGVVNFTGASPQIGASNFNDLTITVSGTATLTGNATIARNLTVSTGTLSVSSPVTANGAGTLTVSNGATLSLGGTNGFPTGYASVSLGNACSTVDYSGTAQTVSAQSYGTLSLSGSGTKTMPSSAMTIACNFTLSGTAAATTAAAVSTTGNLSVGPGTALTVPGFNFAVTGTTSVSGTLTHNTTGATITYTGNVTVNSGGSWIESAAITPSFAGNLQNDGTFTASTGIHTFTGAATKTFSGANTIAIPSVTISGTYQNNGTLTVATALSINTGAAFANGANATLNLGGTVATAGTGTFTATANPNLVVYNGTSSQSVRATTYHNLTLSNAAGTTAGGAFAINNNLSITAGTFSDNGNQIAGNINGTLSALSGTGLTLGIAGTATAFPTTFTAAHISLNAASTVTYAAGVAQAVSTTPAYGNLTFNGGGTMTTAAGTLSVAGDWTASSTTALNTSNTTVTVTGSLAGTGAITQGTNGITVGGDWTNNGAFTATSAGVTLTGSGKQITGASGLTFTTLTVNGSYTNNNPGTLNVSTALSGTGTLTQGSGATLAIAGSAGINALDANTNANTVIYNGGAAQIVIGTAYRNLTINKGGGSTGTLGGATTVNGNLNISAGVLADNGNQIAGNASNTLTIASGAALTLGGAGSGTLFPTNFTSFAINSASTVSYVAGVAQTVSNVTTYGNLTINKAAGNANLAGNTTVGGTLTLSNGSLVVGSNTLSLNGPSTSITSGTLSTTSTSSLSFGGSSPGVITVPNVGNLNNLTVNNATATSITLGGTINLAGTVLISAGTLNASSFNLNVQGDFTNNGAFTAGSGTVTMSGTAAQTIAGSASTTFNNLTLSNTSAAVNASATTNAMSVNGTFTVNANATLAPAAAMVVGGTGTLTGNGTVQVTRTAATADFSSQYTITGKTLTNLTVEYKTGGQTVSAITYGNLKINLASGTATLASGTTTVGATANSTKLSLANGTLAVAGNTLALNGDNTVVTSGTLSTTASSSLSFGGSSAGVNVPSSVAQLKNLTINNANGITLNSSVTINNTGFLTFTSGVITTGANTLYIAAGGGVSRTSGHVFGNLKKNVGTGAQSPNFEIGDAALANYTPVLVTFTSVGTAGDLTATTISGEHPQIANSTINSADDVNRYWTLTNSGIGFTSGGNTASAALTYLSGDNDSPTTTFADYGIGKADSCSPTCTWTYPTLSGTPTSTGAAASGLTSFSDLAVGNNIRSFTIGNIATQQQGISFNFTATAINQSGTTATSFNGTVAVTCNNCTFSSGTFTSGTFTNGVLSIPATIIGVTTGTSASITVTKTGSTATGTSNSFTVTPPTFNAFETTTAANAASGFIYTKVVNTAFSLSVVAIQNGAQLTNFNDNVKLELLANTGTPGSGYGADGCPTSNTLLQTIASTNVGPNGRRNIAFAAVSAAYRDVKVRISYPTGTATRVICSGDLFAVRPDHFAVSITHADRKTAGTTTALDNTGVSGSDSGNNKLHNAGRPFTISATAQDASNTTVTNYSGTPNASVLSACVGAACTASFGTFTQGAWGNSSGVVTTTTASYNEVGSFQAQIQDTSWASLDSTDTGITAAQYTISSSAFNVGRFVPDHFDVGFNTPQFATACTAGTFTYVGQSFNYATAPVLTVTAKEFAGGTTTKYTGSPFWRLATAGIGSYSALTGTLSTVPPTTPSSISESNGVSTLTFGDVTSKGVFSRTTPVVKFDAEISLAVTVSDTDGVVYESPAGTSANPARFGQASAGNGIGFSSGKEMRFGRLHLLPAVGPAYLALKVPVQTEYWTASGWQVSPGDSCTSLPQNTITLGNYGANLSACKTRVYDGSAGTTVAFTGGLGKMYLAAPGSGNDGSVALTANLGASGAGSYCPTVGGSGNQAATAGANLDYLQGAWDGGSTWNVNPSARAAFGVYGAQPRSFIYQRENY